MSSGEREEKQCKCGKAISVVNLQRVGTMVKDMREPCLSQSPIKVVITVRLLLSLIYSVTFYILLCFILFIYSYYCDRDSVVDAVGRKNA